MAVIARYIFSNREAAEAAMQKISYEIGSGSAHFYADEISITEECRDFSKASKICQAYGGRPK